MFITFKLVYVATNSEIKKKKKKKTNILLQHTSRKELKRKEVDDVLGGADAWKNVDSTEGIKRVYFFKRKKL